MKDLKKMPNITGIPWIVEKLYSNMPIWKYADRYQVKMNKVVSRFSEPRLQVVNVRDLWYYTGETDLTFDGLHPNIAGYNKIAKLILKKIEENEDLMSRLKISKVVI